MKRHITINEPYKGNQALISLLNNFELCSSFDEKIYSNRRNTLWAHTIEGMEKIVVKVFKYDTFRQLKYTVSKRSKAKLAYDNAMTLLNHGISTPEPVAFVDVTEGGLVKYSALVTLYTPDQDVSVLIDEDKECASALASLIAQMHSAGIVHHDMNSSNVLYSIQNGGYRLSLIDLNRMKVVPSVGFKDEMDDLVRFTGNLQTFINVIYPYAACRHYDIEPFVRKAISYKIKHDAAWTRKKKLKQIFK